MSKAMNSPTGRILRSSRLFSMPPPLPQPAMELHVRQSGQIRVSDAATQPYPTRQAITSPASSRHRGDWGLKRPLPEKTNNTSTPYVRINAMDTLEHITDFDSAADHTQSRRKWQEMNIHMTHIPPRTASAYYDSIAPRSAFHDATDSTVLPSEGRAGEPPINSLPLGAERALRVRALKSKGLIGERERWKFMGPSLNTMPEAEFDRYVQRIVESPEMQAQFREYLLDVRKKEKRRDAQDKLRNEHGFDETRAEDVQLLEEAAKMEDPQQEIDQYMLTLRNQGQSLSSKLSRLVAEFFDLPPFPEPSHASLSAAIKGESGSDIPPKTNVPPVHPSAGLSYIRSGTAMENHPAHGPQWDRSPVEARVLRTRETAFNRYDHALLGVGGFIARDRSINPSFKSSEAAKGQRWKFDQPDFHKMLVKPLYGFVNEDGKVCLPVEYADPAAASVKLGHVEQTETDAEFRARQKRVPSRPRASKLQDKEVETFQRVVEKSHQAVLEGMQRKDRGL